MISKEQIKLIHVAKSKIGLSEDSYRAILNSFGVQSSKELDEARYKELMKTFKGLGFGATMTPGNTGSEYRVDKFNNRLLSESQLRKAKAMWYTNPNVRVRTDEALNAFVKRIIGVDKLAWVRMDVAQKLFKAIEGIK